MTYNPQNKLAKDNNVPIKNTIDSETKTIFESEQIFFSSDDGSINLNVDASGDGNSESFFVFGETESFVTGLGFFIVDEISETNALAYDSLMGLASLQNGMLITKKSKDNVLFYNSIKQLSDFVQGFNDTTIQTGGDGINRWIKIESKLEPPIKIQKGESLSIEIQDNLSGLLMLRASLKIVKEIPRD